MAEYIEREATCGDCIHACLCEHDASIPLFNRENKAYCGNFFPADVAPVRHGRWEARADAFGFVRCSACKDCNIYDEWADGEKWLYCPSCGARMDLEVSE